MDVCLVAATGLGTPFNVLCSFCATASKHTWRVAGSGRTPSAASCGRTWRYRRDGATHSGVLVSARGSVACRCSVDQFAQGSRSSKYSRAGTSRARASTCGDSHQC